MAEAHSAVAFTFSVTHEGVDVNVNHEALWAIWSSGVLSWKKRIGRMKNNFINGMYPAGPISLLFLMAIVLALKLADVDPSWGLINYIQDHLPGAWDYRFLDTRFHSINLYISCCLFSILLWILKVTFLRICLRILLSYMGWMYEIRGKMSMKTKMWAGLVRLIGGRTPLLNSYQNSLPNLPVPAVKDTLKRYLLSVRPLMDDEEYEKMKKLATEFEESLGSKLQRYLILKSWWATNYVSDWWEEYVYLRGRSPIMVNSNFYGVDALLVKPSCIQVARAANVIHCILMYRRDLEREELKPLMLNKTVPLCSAQYEKQFNSTRIPGIETDTLVHRKHGEHIVVYHKGRFFKVYLRHKGRILMPCEIELQLQKILDDPSEPAPGEKHLAALTAGDRVPWAKARKEYFSKGKNKASLDAIEKAIFFVALDDEPQDYDPNDESKLNRFGHSMLHGKGYDRWFDKSFTLVVTSNGRIGFNAEHSWADAPIMAHMWEVSTVTARKIGYTEDGHCLGDAEIQPPNPIKLEWDLPLPCQDVIKNSLQVANQLLNDVDLHLIMHNQYGKGFIKTCKVSPDAYIQMALQLAYITDQGKFCLTYESSMTRLFREGRTETVRSCSLDSVAFCRAMEDKTKTVEDRKKLLRQACDNHQQLYRDAMTGKGVDRHLFCLYVVSKYLGEESPFLQQVLSQPWRLSTSQTPHQQTDMIDLKKHPDHICGGGGFGPVADDGYGVSYIIAGEDCIMFHVSCKNSCSTTNSKKFGDRIVKAMNDIKNLFNTD
ncbi:carnitine O-palmitoyltransferase 1, liver isoform-like isoform X2 [Liolophura sinensis]|uniref:carnitine O-palmitoyltransferase 1, liver isoform-like isoform X2 n=1 Tax=Liolophura sinensis TaxID=3198878 RepID=UPI00315924BC